MEKSKQRLLRVPDIIKRTDEQLPIPAFAVRRVGYCCKSRECEGGGCKKG